MEEPKTLFVRGRALEGWWWYSCSGGALGGWGVSSGRAGLVRYSSSLLVLILTGLSLLAKRIGRKALYEGVGGL